MRTGIFLGICWLLVACQSESNSSPWYSWKPSGLSENFSIKTRAALAAPPKTQVQLTLAITSDLHGWITMKSVFPKRSQGLAHLSLSIQKLRQEGFPLILLDGGDIIQGDPTTSYAESFQSPQALPIIQLMNQLRYDAVTLGNHDLEAPPRLKKAIHDSNFPWLAANVTQQDGSLFLPPYQIIERAGVRVGILGLTTPGIPLWIDPEHWKGLQFEDMVQTAKTWITVLRQQEKVDVLIGLFHSGAQRNYDQQNAQIRGIPLPNAAGDIADYLEGFDLIISGHAHRTYPHTKTSKLPHYRTPLVSPGSQGEGLSVVRLFLTAKQQRWVLKRSTYEYLPATQIDSQIITPLAPQLEQMEHYLDSPSEVVITRAPTKALFESCGQLLTHKAVTESNPESPYSLLPSGWRWEFISEDEFGKPLKRRHLFRWIPYDNELVRVQLYGRQIEILLEHYFRQKKGQFYHFNAWLYPGGFEQNGMASLQNNAKQSQIPPDIKLFRQESYAVWMTNYHWNGGAGLAGKALLPSSPWLTRQTVSLREFLFSYLKKNQVPLPSSCQSFLTWSQTLSKSM
ncbi:metallophosphoesterase [Deltaproteobacteria bacterium TL4]